jgi:hypothetical protein
MERMQRQWKKQFRIGSRTMQFMGNRDRETFWLAMAASELAKQSGQGKQPMASNEHPDMSGNPCDNPITSDCYNTEVICNNT